MPSNKDEKKNDIPSFDLETEVTAAPGHYLLREEEEPTDFSMKLPDQSKDQAQFATVISVGMGFFDQGSYIEPQAKEGDLVYFEKWKGVELERGRGRDQKKYKIIEFKFLAAIINRNQKKGE